MAIMGLELNETLRTTTDNMTLDLGKVISGILMGIGFIGAGSFIQHREVHLVGSTTGSCIWASGGMGLLLGFGFYYMALMGAVVILFVLLGLNRILGLFMKENRMDND
jgi:putative Mg2+ transporter-C (MgtC) family protein